MDLFSIILKIFGGLGLFLLGMQLLSDGMKKVAGSRMRRIIEMFTNKPIIGVITGALVTSVIQSSSGTTVMTVGFVNAGVMNLVQAIGIIMGANIGTTMTAQLIAFRIESLAPLAIGIGSFGYLFWSKKKIKNWMMVLLGFGILFFGMATMSSGLSPLKDDPHMMELFRKFSHSPILGLLIGTILTCIVQSSSATIGMLQALVGSGLVDFQGAVPILLGDNIGTTITAQLAALNANTNAKRVAMFHTLFNAIGAVLILIFLPYFIDIVSLVTFKIIGKPFDFVDANGYHPSALRYVANAHSIFNITCTLVYLPFVKPLAWLVTKIIPDRLQRKARLSHVDKSMEVIPSIALNQAINEVERMSRLVKEMYSEMDGFFRSLDSSTIEAIKEKEEELNSLYRDLITFIIDLNQQPLDTKELNTIPGLIHTVNDLERVGDHIINLSELTERMEKQNIKFSEETIGDMEHMYALVGQMTELAQKLIIKPEKNYLAMRIIEIEGKVDSMEDTMRDKYVTLRNCQEDHPEINAFIIEGIMNLERIGDHFKNIASALKPLEN
ncbi:MAG: Na/Pi cotransporter family protein [Candidatus Coatesbacteria bacterium]|nr:Na/Pi cotransporter family protein [Candidatus Coatesbacteria bacterium]